MVKNFIDLSKCTLAEFANNLELCCWVVSLDFTRLLNDFSYFFNGAESLNLLLSLDQNGSKRNSRVLLHELMIEEFLKQGHVCRRDIAPANLPILSYRETNLHVLRCVVFVHQLKR